MNFLIISDDRYSTTAQLFMGCELNINSITYQMMIDIWKDGAINKASEEDEDRTVDELLSTWWNAFVKAMKPVTPIQLADGTLAWKTHDEACYSRTIDNSNKDNLTSLGEFDTL